MTVGKTHSGKTTFGRELVKKVKGSCVIDADDIAIFLKETYPSLYDKTYIKKNDECTQGYYLKRATYLSVCHHALRTKLTVILSNANAYKMYRDEVCAFAHQEKRKIVMIYFNLPEDILLQRISTTDHSMSCLSESKSFEDLLLHKQATFEPPSRKEADIFFEINDDKSRKAVQKAIIALINKSK